MPIHRIVGVITFWAAIILIVASLIVGILGCLGASPVGEVVGDLKINGATGTPINSCALGFLAFSLSVSGWFLGLAGTLFDYSVIYLVVYMSAFIGKMSPFGEGIKLAWTITRDVMNLAIIIGLIYAAISLILQLGDQNRPGPLIVRVLIAALLINFSYFFGAIIIDASNFVSQKIYEEGIYSGDRVNPLPGGRYLFGAPAHVAPISERFMIVTRLGSIYDFKEGIKAEEKIVDDVSTVLIAVLGTALFSFAASIFITAALFLFLRFVLIIILLAVSPLGVLYFTDLPGLKEWGAQWWTTLKAQALFPVIFLFLVALSFKVLEVGIGTTNTGDRSLVGLVTGGKTLDQIYANVDLVATFIIAWLLLFFSLRAASSIAQEAKVSPPSPAAAFKFAGQAGNFIGRWTSPARLAQQLFVGATKEFPKTFQGPLGDTGALIGDTGKGIVRGLGLQTRGEKFQRRVEDARYASVLNATRNWDKLTPEEREAARKDFDLLTEKQRDKLVNEARRIPNGPDNLVEVARYAKATDPKTKQQQPEEPEEKEKEKKPEPKKKTPGGGAETTASLAVGQRRVSEGLASLQRAVETGDQNVVRGFNQLAALERLDQAKEFFASRTELLADRENTRRLASVLGPDMFNEAVQSVPSAKFGEKVAQALAPHLSESGYSALRGRSDMAPHVGSLDAAMESQNPSVKRRVDTTPGGLFS